MKNKSLGTIISKRRKIMRLTQTDLAEKMDVTEQAVSKWERNQSCPDINTFAKLAEVLGVSSDELLSIKDNKVVLAKKSAEDIIGIILCAVAMGMAVAVVVTNILNAVDSRTSLIMLGIGAFCIALFLLNKNN